jgi:beta-glucosidase-like glycosyl hydrolase
MSAFAEVVLPAIRWDAEKGFAPARADIERWLKLGVGGFILFGGEKGAVQALTRDLQEAAHGDLLIASDLERGAGQQVQGLTSLPPLLALAGLGREAVVEAATITAHEARSVGINWVLAPVCDLDIEPRNPIVQTRSLGADAYDVAHYAAAWTAACQAAGALACAKHFPGHGRTTLDSHATLPVVSVGRELERDLLPFRRAVEAGVAAVMTAHVAFPAWEPSGVPATHSRALLRDLLRHDLFFSGLTVTDALIMEGAKGGSSEVEGCLRALRAGCDLLLYPRDPEAAIDGIESAARSDRGLETHTAQASLRREEALHRVAADTPAPGALAGYAERGAALCQASVKMLRGDPPKVRGAVSIEIVDDDAGGPYPLPPRGAFAGELKRLGVEVAAKGERVVLLFADVKSWKGRAGLSADSVARLTTLIGPATPVICFGHPRRQLEIPGLGPVVCAWSGDEAMQRAAAQRFANG